MPGRRGSAPCAPCAAAVTTSPAERVARAAHHGLAGELGSYLGRTPRAMRGKLEVRERGADLVLAAHFTPVAPGLKVTTVETVRFERPQRVSFRLVKGPVPHVVERYELRASEIGTAFEYSGELGTDLWALGTAWAAVVAPSWERTVATSLDAIRAEAERRAHRRA